MHFLRIHYIIANFCKKGKGVFIKKSLQMKKAEENPVGIFFGCVSLVRRRTGEARTVRNGGIRQNDFFQIAVLILIAERDAVFCEHHR